MVVPAAALNVAAATAGGVHKVAGATAGGVHKAAAAERPFARYNPLRPAAAAVVSSAVPVAITKVKAKASSEPRPMAFSKLPSGLIVEELSTPSSAVVAGGMATLKQECELRFTLLLAGKKPKQVERGQVRCRLGESEIIDGWVDGNVDLEEVLASLGKGVVGMSAGSRRRIHVPARLGFKDGVGRLCLRSRSSCLTLS